MDDKISYRKCEVIFVMKEDKIWGFIHKAEKVLFPKDIKTTWTLLVEYIPDGEVNSQYRLYKDENGNNKFVKIDLSTGANI